MGVICWLCREWVDYIGVCDLVKRRPLHLSGLKIICLELFTVLVSLSDWNLHSSSVLIGRNKRLS